MGNRMVCLFVRMCCLWTWVSCPYVSWKRTCWVPCIPAARLNKTRALLRNGFCHRNVSENRKKNTFGCYACDNELELLFIMVLLIEKGLVHFFHRSGSLWEWCYGCWWRLEEHIDLLFSGRLLSWAPAVKDDHSSSSTSFVVVRDDCKGVDGRWVPRHPVAGKRRASCVMNRHR